MGPHDDTDQRNEWADERAPRNSRVPDDAPLPGAEHVEQYTRLHEHIERLRADRRPERPPALSDDEAGAYAMAAELRAAAPGAAEPDPAFILALGERLRAASTTPPPPAPSVSPAQPAATERSVPPRLPRPPAGTVERTEPVTNAGTTGASRGGVSRRAALSAGLTAAAAILGVTAGAAIERTMEITVSGPPRPSQALIPDGAGDWVTVASIAELPQGAVKRFAVGPVVGFVRHTSAGFAALSGVCTHMGCLLNWNGAAQTYDCPCHGGRFNVDGASSKWSSVAYSPLPTIETQVVGDQVQV